MTQENHIQCIIVDDEAIAREIIATHLSKLSNIHVLKSFGDAIEALNFLREAKVDLIFLDINMPEISGISFAKSINKKTKVIFTTAYRDYAVEGFELKAVDYLLKPVSFDKISNAVNTYHQTYFFPKKAELNTFIFVRADRKMVKVNFDEILFIESFGDYLKIHLSEETVVTRETISTIEQKLPTNNFLRIHRSFVVSLKEITSYTNEEIIVKNKSLPISRSYKNAVLNTLSSF